ncbi:hypothetical protein IAU60_002817 [Kwoniella sp. DSM 27419]
MTHANQRYTYKHLDEFFVLSEWEEDVKGSFGLRPPPGDWPSFVKKIEDLNAQCPEGESVRVIYAARHGQAEHNAIAEQYGEEGQIMHPVLDPDLTPLGRSQAYQTRLALRREVKRGMPLPMAFFVSPLRRAGETCGIEWGWLFGDDPDEESTSIEADVEKRVNKDWNGGQGHGVPAVAIENIREHLHVHQCDARLSVSKLKTLFPSFTYPEGMSDQDTLWQPADVRGRETEEELVARRGDGIAEVLERSEKETYISVTAHSGALRGIHKSLNVPTRRLVVGEMNVLVVRVKENR